MVSLVLKVLPGVLFATALIAKVISSESKGNACVFGSLIFYLIVFLDITGVLSAGFL